MTTDTRLVPTGLSHVYTAAYESIRTGAPGLSDDLCKVIARAINMKVALSKDAAPVTLPRELVERLTRPIIGLEHRTAHEVFDMMSDRIRQALTAAPSERREPSELTPEQLAECLNIDGPVSRGQMSPQEIYERIRDAAPERRESTREEIAQFIIDEADDLSAYELADAILALFRGEG